MEQVIVGGHYSSLDVTLTEYNALCGGFPWIATESRREQLISTAGKLKNLRVELDGVPGTGTYVFTVRLNGAPTNLTCEVAADGTSASDTNQAHNVTITGGDRVCLECNPDNPDNARYARWTTMFEGDTANESLILGATENSTTHDATEYNNVMGFGGTWTADEDNARQVIPTAGVIKNLYIQLDFDIGTAPDAYTFTLRVNGADSNDGVNGGNPLEVTIVAEDTTGNDTTHEITVSAGDIVTLECEPIETPGNAGRVKWGMTFVADTNGESIIMSGNEDIALINATEYNYPISQYGINEFDWTATEAERYMLAQACTLKNLYILLSQDPSAGDSYTFTVRRNGASPADGLVVLIENAATTGNDTTHTITVSDDDELDMMSVPDSEPDAVVAYWGLVCFIAPPTHYSESAIVYIGVKVSKVRLLGITRASSVLIGNLVSASKVWGIVKSASVLIGDKVTATRVLAIIRLSSVLIGNKVSAIRLLGIIRLSLVLIGNKVTATGVRGVTRLASVLIGNKVTAIKIWGIVKSSSVLVGNKVTAIRLLGIIRLSPVLIGNKVTASKIWGIVKSSLVLVGNKVSAIRLLGIVRLSSVLIGNKVSAIRLLALIRKSSVLIGNKVTASGIVAYIRQSSVLIGVKVTAIRLLGIDRDSSVLIGVKVSAIRLLGIIRESKVSIGVLVSASKIWGIVKSAIVKIGVKVSVYFCTWLKKLSRVPISRMAISRIPFFHRVRSCE